MADLSAKGLLKSDEHLKSFDHKWLEAKSEQEIETTKKALEAKKYDVHIVHDEKEALEAIKKLVPNGASVYATGSTTLQEIGFIEYLKGQTPYDNLKAKILSETDPVKQGELWDKAYTADYFFSSTTAVTHNGEFLAADASGTRVGGFVSSKNLVIVMGSNKIVADKATAHKRTQECSLPMESARARVVYKVPGSVINNLVEINGPNPYGKPGRIHFIIVKKSLGF